MQCLKSHIDVFTKFLCYMSRSFVTSWLILKCIGLQLKQCLKIKRRFVTMLVIPLVSELAAGMAGDPVPIWLTVCTNFF